MTDIQEIHGNPTESDNPQALCLRIQELQYQFAEMERRNNRRRRTFLLVGITLSLVVIGYLGLLTRQAFQLDAGALTQIGRLEVEKQLPSKVDDLTRYLKAEAPRLVSQLLNSSLELFPHLRTAIVLELDSKIEAITESFEEEFTAQMEESVRVTKADLELLGAEKSDGEKLELLVNHVADEFQSGATAAFRELYPHYASEFNRIKSLLADLQHKDESQLSERERTQKELIQTLLRLLSYEEFRTH